MLCIIAAGSTNPASDHHVTWLQKWRFDALFFSLSSFSPSISPSSLPAEMNDARLERLLEEIGSLRAEVSGLRTEVTSLRTEVRGLRTTIAGNNVSQRKSGDPPAARRVIPQPATMETPIDSSKKKKKRIIPDPVQHQTVSRKGSASPSPEPYQWRIEGPFGSRTRAHSALELNRPAPVPDHLAWLRNMTREHQGLNSEDVSSKAEPYTWNLPLISPGGGTSKGSPESRGSDDVDDFLGLHMYGYDDLSQDSEGCDICGGPCSRLDGCVNDNIDDFFD